VVPQTFNLRSLSDKVKPKNFPILEEKTSLDHTYCTKQTKTKMCIADIAGYKVKVDFRNKEQIRLKSVSGSVENKDSLTASKKLTHFSDDLFHHYTRHIRKITVIFGQFALAFFYPRVTKSIPSFLHGIFWLVILAACCPILGIALLALTVHRIITWIYQNVYRDGSNTRINVHFNAVEASGKEQKLEHELAVFISGCDRGFGQSYAFELAERGFIVFAGCLSEEGIRQYDNIPSITAVKLDVTKDEDADNVASIVKNWLCDSSAVKNRYLHAIINNAGIGSNGPIDWTPVEDFENVMEVNYFGMIRCVKAFLPTLKAQAFAGPESYKDARIITMGSFAGHIALPGSPSYVVSKHAVQDFSSCLRMELKSFDLPVVTVNPSVHGTTMLDYSKKHFEAKWNNLSPQVRREYGEESFQKWKDMLDDVVCIMWESKSVVEEVIKCMESKYPSPEVIVGMDAKFILVFLKMMPTWIVVKILSMVSPQCSKNGQFTNTITVKKSM